MRSHGDPGNENRREGIGWTVMGEFELPSFEDFEGSVSHVFVFMALGDVFQELPGLARVGLVGCRKGVSRRVRHRAIVENESVEFAATVDEEHLGSYV